MNMQRKTTVNGLTGFWMRVDYKLNVRVVNGTMYKLLSAKKGFILTHILSRHIHRQFLRSILHERRFNRRTGSINSSYPRVYGLIGLKARSKSRGWGINTTLHGWKVLKGQADTWQSTYLNPPFSRLTGLKAGSASGIHSHFLMLPKGKPTP